MLNQKDYKQLKEKIYLVKHPECKTIEEAMQAELKFGCEFEYKKTKWIFIQKFKGKFILQTLEKWRPIVLSDEVFDIFDNIDRLTILGRPITLSDVLLACSEIKIVEIPTHGGWVKAIALKWNFKNNNLDNQSDETKQLSIDLLENKGRI